MSKKLNHSLAIGIFLIGILLSSISEGFSQTTNYFTWNNSTNTWSTTTAWNPTGGPQLSSSTTNTNVAVFAATGAGNNTVLLGSDKTVYGLIFTNGANAYTFGSVSTAKQLDIMNFIGLQNVSGQNQIFNLSVANNGTGGVWSNSVGSTTTFNNGLQLTTAGSSASRTLTLAGAGTWNVASAIANGGTSGTNIGTVTVTATGTTILSGSNTYDGLTTMIGTNGTLTLSGNNSGAAGGVTLTAGTLNINNNNALGTGLFSFGSSANATTIDNTSGNAVVNAGNNAMTWNGTIALTFGSSNNTAANNLDLGTGTVTLTGSRTVNLLGTGTKLTIGAATINGLKITANGAGNTLEMRGLSLTTNTNSTLGTVDLGGTANINITGAIVNGTVPGSGLNVTNTGTTTLSGTNTYTGLTTMNATNGTLNLTGNNSSATGGTLLTTGTLNINNANALSTGLLELGAVTSSAYGSSIINNTSGGSLTFSGLSGVKWSGTAPAGIQFGTSNSTSTNSMDFGAGLVTTTTSRALNIAGTGVKISMGTLTTTGTSDGYTFTFDGAGNTMDLDGWKISTAAAPTSNVVHQIKGSANVTIGAIENGTAGFLNGVEFNSGGTTRLTGDNTYTGTTRFLNATNILSGNNSAAVGNVTIAGSSGTDKTPYVRLDNINAISSSSSLLGSSSTSEIGTLDLSADGNFTLNSFGTAGAAGNNMIFTNSSSSGSQKTLTFTAATNFITASGSGGRTLYNYSANLLVDFDGDIEIGGTSVGNDTSFSGVGNFNVDGNLLDTGVGGARSLRKQGDGTLTLRGSANSYRGSTKVEGGKLEVGATGALPTASAITVSSGATLKFSQASGEINVGAMTNSGTLEQNLVTIRSSGAVNFLTNSTLKVNGSPTELSYTLVTGNSLTGTPTLSPAITNYQLTNSNNSLVLLSVGNQATPPSAPTITGVTTGDGQLSVAFTDPSDTGGASITGYKWSVDGTNYTLRSGTANPIVITGLNNGQAYTVRIRAVNGAGDGAVATAGSTATPVSPGTTFASWSDNATPTPDLIKKYAFGALNKSSEAQKMTSSIVGGKLILTAVVRTDDTLHLTITAKTATSLSGSWSTSPTISVADASDQSGFSGVGLVRKDFKVDCGSDTKRFLKLEAVYTP